MRLQLYSFLFLFLQFCIAKFHALNNMNNSLTNKNLLNIVPNIANKKIVDKLLFLTNTFECTNSKF